MAAISATSSIIGLVVNLFISVSLGANVTIAYAVGRDDKQAVSRAVHTAIAMAVLGGVLAAVLGELAAAPLLWALHTPEDVLPLSLLYLRIYFAGLLVSLLYNFEAAIFRSIGETKIPLIALASSGVLNVLLNLFFVAALHMTVDGVATATVLSKSRAPSTAWAPWSWRPPARRSISKSSPTTSSTTSVRRAPPLWGRITARGRSGGAKRR